MASTAHHDTSRRVFHALPDPTGAWAFTETASRSFLRKWDLSKNARARRFRYTTPFHRMNPDGFLVDFFNSEVVNEHLQVMGSDKQWRSVVRGVPKGTAGLGDGDREDSNEVKNVGNKKCVKVAYEKIQCTSTSMQIFDPLKDGSAEPRIVRDKSDALMRRVEDIIQGFPVGDELRAFLLDEANGNFENQLVAPENRREFLWKIFEHLVLGGASCQYEDSLSPYENTTKAVYKSLVRAKKKEETDGDETNAAVVSDVYLIKSVSVSASCATETETEVQLFPKPGHKQNWCYLCVDPWRKHVTVWYHGYVPYW